LVNPFDLTGKTILVTGASSGIGRAICVACSQARARLVLVARNEERLAETRALCAGEGHEARTLDLGDLDAIPRFLRDVCKEVGPLAGLVHSAGQHQLKPLRALRGADMQNLFTVNAASGVMLIKGLAARGCCTQPASAVLLSSVMGSAGEPGATAYCMSKGALEAAVRCLALELAAEGIRVNAVAPATIETEMTAKSMGMLGQELLAAVRAQHPSGFGRAEDVTGAVLFLLSDASRYVTGVSLPVDGGYLAR